MTRVTVSFLDPQKRYDPIPSDDIFVENSDIGGGIWFPSKIENASWFNGMGRRVVISDVEAIRNLRQVILH